MGGISVTGMGLFAVESHHQKERNLDTVFTKDDAFEFIMDRTHWQLDAKIARAYVDKSADTIEWLEDMGVHFVLMDKLTFPGEIHQTGHLVNSSKMGIGANATADLIDKLYARALSVGAEVQTEAAVTDIQKTDYGYQILYNRCFRKVKKQYQRKAVIITGGGIYGR
mgnify:CR=1 FL=1